MDVRSEAVHVRLLELVAALARPEGRDGVGGRAARRDEGGVRSGGPGRGRDVGARRAGQEHRACPRLARSPRGAQRPRPPRRAPRRSAQAPGLRPRAHRASLLDPVCAHPDHLQVLRPALARQVPEQQSDAWLHVAPEGPHAPGVVVVVLLVVVQVVVVGGTKSKLPSEVTGDRLPTPSTICTARYTTCPVKPGSPTTSDVPPSWLPRGGVGGAATGVAASNAAWVVMGPAREKRKSKRAAVPQ